VIPPIYGEIEWSSNHAEDAEIALSLVARFDDQGVLAGPDCALLLQTLGKTYRVVVALIGDVAEINAAIHSQPRGRIGRLVIFAHGDEEGLQLTEKSVFQKKDVALLDYRACSQKAEMILLSCFGGKGFGQEFADRSLLPVSAPAAAIRVFEWSFSFCRKHKQMEVLAYDHSGRQYMQRYVPSQISEHCECEMADHLSYLDSVGEFMMRRMGALGNMGQVLGRCGLFCEQRGDLLGAEKWYREAAGLGDPLSQYVLGEILEDRGDLVEANEWYRKSAKGGNADAQYAVGLAARDLGDIAEAESWWQKAAGLNDCSALIGLGIIYLERGKSLAEKKNLSEAEVWYGKAEHQFSKAVVFADSLAATLNLGILGELRGNLSTAKSWYRDAAEAGSVKAQLRLGYIARDQGDLVEAESWWQEAKDQGCCQAFICLGEIYMERGETSAKEKNWEEADVNYNMAENLFSRAVVLEDLPVASFNLGVLNELRENFSVAKSWYRDAVLAGYADAQIGLDRLSKKCP
jgi:hypothetical protein